jgi:hypothetical protein
VPPISYLCGRRFAMARRMLFLVAVNPSSRKLIIVVLSALGVVAGCGGGNPLQVGRDGGSAGQGGSHGAAGQGGGSAPACGPNSVAVYCPDCNGGRVFEMCSDPGAIPACPNRCLPPTQCSGLDEASCAATPGCASQICPTCYGQTAFTTCYRSVDPPPVCIALPCAPLPDCSTLDETSCKTSGECWPQYCPDCKGGQTFTGCAVRGSGGACPPSCPQPSSCDTLGEKECQVRSDCHPGYCADCSGTQKFTLCVGPNEAVACPGYNCPAQPASCAGVDLPGCNARPWCTPYQCPDCKGGQLYAGCAAVGGAGIECGPCPQPASCADVTTQAACDARTDCHSVFGKCLVCDCQAPGCPVHFTSCADGGKATCRGTPLCQTAPPSCDWTTPYVVSYTAGCYEGCVRPTECAP